MSASYQGDHYDFRDSAFNGPFINEQHIRLPRHEVDWPVRVGIIPEPAAHYQHRDITDLLGQDLRDFGTVILRQVLSGAGGVGKTQLAAHHARTLREITDPDQRVDVLVWVNAATRVAITSAYAHAAHQLFNQVPEDAEDAARLFLTWLADPNKHRNRRWLIVWDDLTDPERVRDLWPPHDQPCGRVLVTTRRRDHSLTVQGRRLVDVDAYTPAEARAFLTRALDTAGIAHAGTDVDALAHALGHLPLALGQVVPYMAELGMDCRDYLGVFNNRMSTLHEVFPDWDTDTPLAATWDLSLAQADTFHPQGLARPLMGLIALLDGTGIPEHVLTASSVLEYLASHRISEHAPSGSRAPDSRSTAPELSAHQLRTALAGLHRLNLIIRTVSEGGSENAERVIRVHQLVQRATRDHQTTRPTPQSVRAAADALVGVWPSVERDTALVAQLRSNTHILRNHIVRGQHVEEWLWETDGHTVLFQAGRSLGESGRVVEAITYWERMVQSARCYLDPDHPDVLTTRHNLARWLGKAGDPQNAVRCFEQLLVDRIRILGPDHPHTLANRHNLAYWQGHAGRPARAVTALDVLLDDHLRVFGAHHPDTLRVRNSLALWRGHAGDPNGAATAFGSLLTDRVRVLGPYHPDTLIVRNNLAYWRGKSGDPAGAAEVFEELLTDRRYPLGADHPHTLVIRGNHARWTYESGNTAKAVELFIALLHDQRRVLGSDHSNTQATEQLLASEDISTERLVPPDL